ncbi:MAG TPA: hypothetical protein VJ044_15720, partial [Candidatus Hodarchaeales archaeon]|nr:hypothetical protein [Candidatus Hodarchaeales archaeon]
IEHLDLGMLMSEKEAYVRFPLFDNGALSTEFALHGKNINFLKFCYDLFQFYWEQAEPASDF